MAECCATRHSPLACHKLARRFLGDDPPAEIVQKAAAIFAKTKGDLTSTTRLLLLDGVAKLQPWQQSSNARSTPSPPHCVNSTPKVTAAPPCTTFSGAWGSRSLPGPCPMVTRIATPIGSTICSALAICTGADAKPDHWHTDRSAILMPTVQIVDAQTPTAMLDRLSHLLLGQSLSPSDQDLLLTVLHAPLADAGADEWCATLAAGMIASPAFQWH